MNNNTFSEKKYAIYGGTFDPIHIAHVKLADSAVKEIGISELYFMPAYISPFKKNDDIASARDRLNMIETVLNYNPAFRISDFEIAKMGVSYTIETLEYWREKLDGKLYFIAGFDSLVTMDKWYRGEDILRNFKIITGRRPDTNFDFASEKIKEFSKKFNADIHILKMDDIDISSTEIRSRLRLGQNINDLVLEQTEEYIIEHNLYQE